MMLVGSVTLAAAQQRTHLPRYSLEIPAGWSLQVEGERFLPRPSLDGLRLAGEVRRKDHWLAPGNTSGIGTFQNEKLMWIVLPDREGGEQGRP